MGYIGATVRGGVVVVAMLGSAGSASAICNLIPGTSKTFNSTLGATNRPFAAPGERLELAVRTCDTSPGAGLSRQGEALVVS